MRVVEVCAILPGTSLADHGFSADSAPNQLLEPVTMHISTGLGFIGFESLLNV